MSEKMKGLSPGPWHQATRGPNGCPIIGDSKHIMVCMLAHTDSLDDQKERAEANAKLIAAAYEMAEALKWAANSCHHPTCEFRKTKCNCHVEPARAALRSAGIL